MLFQKSSCDWLVVGLGNPGKEYENTRHNTGFQTIDLLAQDLGVSIDRSRFEGKIAMCSLGGQKLCLLKPETFMNLSGRSVRQAADYYKIPPARVLVMFDDISLPVGRIRVRENGSAGGHNGIKSIIAMLGSGEFPRVKIGVDPKPHPDYDLASWVLGKIPAEKQADFLHAKKNAVEAARLVITRGIAEAANSYNGK